MPAVRPGTSSRLFVCVRHDRPASDNGRERAGQGGVSKSGGSLLPNGGILLSCRVSDLKAS